MVQEPSQRSAVLRVQYVTKRFGSLLAVDQASFDLGRQEVLGVAGPNGAGKSTLFGLITRTSDLTPDAGTVELDGSRIEHLSPHRIAKAGLRRTFQAESVVDALTVRENVEVAATYLAPHRPIRESAARRDAASAIEQVGLGDYADRRAGALDLYEKKRLMISTALVGSPKVLLLDEPAGGLNVEEQAQLVALIRGLNQDGMALVVIEHVLSLLRQVASRMLVLVAGGVLTQGRPDDVLRDPRVVEAYLGDVGT